VAGLPFPNIDPVAFSIGPFSVHWYGIAYLVGVLLGAAYGHLLLARTDLWKDGKPPFAAPDIWDFAFWAVIGIVAGSATCSSITCRSISLTRFRFSWSVMAA
jgi:phosphatidylglycerol:prolipoprotein diacylglycerol transferase